MSAAKHTPEALRLAAWLEANVFGKGITEKNDLACAAELRRLHAENAELLEACKRLLGAHEDEHLTEQGIRNLARAAIAKAGGAA